MTPGRRQPSVLPSRVRTAVAMCAATATLVAWGTAQAQISARVAATKEQVQSFVGHTDVKVLFYLQGETYYVDYSEATPQIRKFAGLSGASLAVISPTGEWITYQTGCDQEGGGAGCGGSSIYIRPFAETATAVKIMDNGFVPRFVDSAAGSDPEVLYASTVNCPALTLAPWTSDTTLWPICFGAGQMAKRKIVGGTSVQSEQVIHAGGSYFGGMSYDGRYLCTAWPAGPNPFMIDLQNAAAGPQPMHFIPIKNTATNADSVARIGCCNPSRSPSRIFTNCTMYFDFGFTGRFDRNPGVYTHPLWGTWAQHQTFFIARRGSGTYGEQLRVYDLPNDQILLAKVTTADTTKAVAAEWANPEWSNHPYYAALSLVVDRLFKAPPPKTGYEHPKRGEGIYLVNLKENTCLRLVTTTDTSYASTVNMVYPYVWVKIPSGFSEDATWLSSVDSSRSVIQAVPVRRDVAPRLREPLRIEVKGGLLRSNSEVSRVTVFSALGDRIWSSGSHPDVSAAFTLPALGPGIYFVKAENAAAESMVARWVVRR